MEKTNPTGTESKQELTKQLKDPGFKQVIAPAPAPEKELQRLLKAEKEREEEKAAKILKEEESLKAKIELQRDLLLVNTALMQGFGTPDLKNKYPDFMKTVYQRMHKNNIK